MRAGRPGARSESADAGGVAALGPREGCGRPRPGAYLDMKIHIEKNLEEERQILLQQQKICRNQARKYFVESNRRKKAFEEKRKEQEEREHQIREQILQQRKQKFEEVTEKFQRAHIPLSQRRRAVFQKPVPPLEEALKQIQDSNLKSDVNLPFSHRQTINWRAVGSALPPALSKNNEEHQKHPSCNPSCDKEMKENSMTDATTNKNMLQLKLEETQKLLEHQHLSSLQKFCDEVNQITNSETLSSMDSLEAREHEEIYLTLTKDPATSVQQNFVSLQSGNLQSTHLNCFDEDKLSFSKTQHINNWLMDLEAQNTQSVISSSDIFSKSSVLPPWEHFNDKAQNPSSLSKAVEKAPSTANNSVVFVYSPPIVMLDKNSEKNCEASAVRARESTPGALRGERPSVTERPTLTFSKAWAPPDSLTQEAATLLDQEKLSGLAHKNIATSAPTSFVPLATPLILPSTPQSARPLGKSTGHVKEVDPVQCSDKLDELRDGKDEKIKHSNCTKEELPVFSDNFEATCTLQNADSKDLKQKPPEMSVSLSNLTSNHDFLDQHKKMKYSIHERNGVRFLKSILKKESKYEHDYLKALIINQGFKFRNQKAVAIRDSIELMKEKEKHVEMPKAIKKLRWFDETGDMESRAGASHPQKDRPRGPHRWPSEAPRNSDRGTSVITVPACAATSTDRMTSKADSVSENGTDLGDSGADHVPLSCCQPLRHTFAKQAWPASKNEESKIPVHNGDSTDQRGNPHRGAAKVSRRTGPARIQSGQVYMNRKGPVTQPQSASPTNAFATQGRLMIPRPPPRPTSTITSGKNAQVSQCQSIMPENSQNTSTHNRFHSKYVLPTEHSSNQWIQESHAPLSDAGSDLVTVIPSLPSYYSSECQTLAKRNHLHGTQMAALQDGTLYCTQRSPVCEESYQSVTLRNTKELVPSRKRGNNTLRQNERASEYPVTRRKGIVENKQRNILQQKRKISGSVGLKYSEQMTNFGQSVQLSSSEPKQTTRVTSNTEEVSDSTSDFLMAENLVNASVPEDEILAVINSKQAQKPNLALKKTQQISICALSAEERKILRSLNHLNEKLHYVQEIICKNPSIKNTLQLTPLLNNQPRASPSPNAGSGLQRKY